MRAEALSEVPLGQRVTVRHRLPDGGASDAVGHLTERTAEAVTLHTRRGPVQIRLRDVLVARVVAAVPWRVASFLRRAGVAVLDLDGVLRTFDTEGHVGRAAGELGMEMRDLLELAFGLPEARAMLTGRSRHAEWMSALRTRLLTDTHPEDAVDRTLAAWLADRGTPLPHSTDLVDELVAAGTPVFVFTNGTDRVPEELEHIGLGHLVPLLLNACDLGFAKPAPAAYAVAHAEIERRLGRAVGRAEVHFTDDRPTNVDAARVFGWQARVFTPPA
ncbi:HAD family hydrolase [Ornithinimicrobium sp. LYQ121]|uniref:HAD family hydrolase n=1 Tax=Ornithinimicrobium sp. LYQ121 TaxID=3378801 RepID=UPI003854067A